MVSASLSCFLWALILNKRTNKHKDRKTHKCWNIVVLASQHWWVDRAHKRANKSMEIFFILLQSCFNTVRINEIGPTVSRVHVAYWDAHLYAGEVFLQSLLKWRYRQFWHGLLVTVHLSWFVPVHPGRGQGWKLESNPIVMAHSPRLGRHSGTKPKGYLQ